MLHPEAADLMKKIRANDHYVPKVADPLVAGHLRRQDQRADVHGLPVDDEQTGGHCPTLAEHITGTNKKWFTFTNGTHVDSLDPETFNRWYDFLELYVAKQAPITNSALIQAAAPVIYQAAMGIDGRDAAARPDPAAADLRRRAGGVRGAAADPRPVRQRRRRRRSPGEPYPGFEQLVRRASRSRARPARSWYLRRRRRAGRRARRSAGGRHVHAGTRTRGR